MTESGRDQPAAPIARRLPSPESAAPCGRYIIRRPTEGEDATDAVAVTLRENWPFAYHHDYKTWFQEIAPELIAVVREMPDQPATVARKLPSDETLRGAVDHLATLLDKP